MGPTKPSPPKVSPPPKPADEGEPRDQALLDAADYWAVTEEDRAPGAKGTKTQPKIPQQAAPAVAATKAVFPRPASKPYRPPLKPLLAERPQADQKKAAPSLLGGRWMWMASALALLAIGVALALMLWPSSRQGAARSPEAGEARVAPRASSEVASAKAPASDTQNPPAKQSPRAGKLSVTSDPPEAHVTVEGDKRGVTPLILADLPLGKPLAIRLELEGYRPWTETVTLTEERRPYEIAAGLVKDSQCVSGTGVIYVISTPTGATVELDGKRLPGKTPLVIDQVCANENHEIRVQATGHIAERQVVQVGPDQVTNLNFPLKK